MLLVTGAAGFIGSNFCKHWLATRDEPLLLVDKLTYAGRLENLGPLLDDSRVRFECLDICDSEAMLRLIVVNRPRCIVHLAAETHVDRAIESPAQFVRTNTYGTFELLEAVRAYAGTLEAESRSHPFFIQVSTDEVFGDLGDHAAAFDESSAYAPNNPYSASKAAADHLVRAYSRTYGLRAAIAHPSNNYGPNQYFEKLIPRAVARALDGRKIPVFGDGLQVRDWIHVEDTCRGLAAIVDRGAAGERYFLGSRSQRTNIEVVRSICTHLDHYKPSKHGRYSELIEFADDRAGHDRRYAIDPTRTEQSLGWRALRTFEAGLRDTVKWYADEHSQ